VYLEEIAGLLGYIYHQLLSNTAT